MSLTLAEAAARYLAALPPSQRQTSQQEVNKFLHWFGGDRPLLELTAPQVAGYAEGLGISVADQEQRLSPLKKFFVHLKKEKLISVSLAPHLRPKKGGRASGVAQRDVEAVKLTRQGHQELDAQMATLKAQRPYLAMEVARARADKDFRENAPLDAAREHQAQVESRIRHLEATLRHAVIIEDGQAPESQIGQGSRVVVLELETQEAADYTLVATQEASLLKGKLSLASPLGKALLGRRVGEVVEVAAPQGVVRYRIDSVS
ncbi:MAG: transcription elongation factor GreA [Chloroflexi bacterium]|nr:transcription elongation factor GreA [Chloroflexota bacterium]